MGTAQFGVWGSFASWVGLCVFAMLKLCRYHQLENIRVSMYRERQRLINENAESPGSSLGRESTTSQQTTQTEVKKEELQPTEPEINVERQQTKENDLVD